MSDPLDALLDTLGRAAEALAQRQPPAGVTVHVPMREPTAAITITERDARAAAEAIRALRKAVVILAAGIRAARALAKNGEACAAHLCLREMSELVATGGIEVPSALLADLIIRHSAAGAQPDRRA